MASAVALFNDHSTLRLGGSSSAARGVSLRDTRRRERSFLSGSDGRQPAHDRIHDVSYHSEISHILSAPLVARHTPNSTGDPPTMSSQQHCERPEMTDAEAIRAVFPRHTMKSLARALGVPIDTARHWIYRHLSKARRREVALALLAQLDAEDLRRQDVRKRLEGMVSGDDEVVSPMARGGARKARAAIN